MAQDIRSLCVQLLTAGAPHVSLVRSHSRDLHRAARSSKDKRNGRNTEFEPRSDPDAIERSTRKRSASPLAGDARLKRRREEPGQGWSRRTISDCYVPPAPEIRSYRHQDDASRLLKETRNCLTSNTKSSCGQNRPRIRIPPTSVKASVTAAKELKNHLSGMQICSKPTELRGTNANTTTETIRESKEPPASSAIDDARARPQTASAGWETVKRPDVEPARYGRDELRQWFLEKWGLQISSSPFRGYDIERLDMLRMQTLRLGPKSDTVNRLNAALLHRLASQQSVPASRDFFLTVDIQQAVRGTTVDGKSIKEAEARFGLIRHRSGLLIPKIGLPPPTECSSNAAQTPSMRRPYCTEQASGRLDTSDSIQPRYRNMEDISCRRESLSSTLSTGVTVNGCPTSESPSEQWTRKAKSSDPGVRGTDFDSSPARAPEQPSHERVEADRDPLPVPSTPRKSCGTCSRVDTDQHQLVRCSTCDRSHHAFCMRSQPSSQEATWKCQACVHKTLAQSSRYSSQDIVSGCQKSQMLSASPSCAFADTRDDHHQARRLSSVPISQLSSTRKDSPSHKSEPETGSNRPHQSQHEANINNRANTSGVIQAKSLSSIRVTQPSAESGDMSETTGRRIAQNQAVSGNQWPFQSVKHTMSSRPGKAMKRSGPALKLTLKPTVLPANGQNGKAPLLRKETPADEPGCMLLTASTTKVDRMSNPKDTHEPGLLPTINGSDVTLSTKSSAVVSEHESAREHPISDQRIDAPIMSRPSADPVTLLASDLSTIPIQPRTSIPTVDSVSSTTPLVSATSKSSITSTPLISPDPPTAPIPLQVGQVDNEKSCGVQADGGRQDDEVEGSNDRVEVLQSTEEVAAPLTMDRQLAQSATDPTSAPGVPFARRSITYLPIEADSGYAAASAVSGGVQQSTIQAPVSVQKSEPRTPYSYRQMIGMALVQAPDYQYTRKQCIEWTIRSFRQVDPSDKTWQNSYAPILSQTAAFQKREAPAHAPANRDYVWFLHPEYIATYTEQYKAVFGRAPQAPGRDQIDTPRNPSHISEADQASVVKETLQTPVHLPLAGRPSEEGLDGQSTTSDVHPISLKVTPGYQFRRKSLIITLRHSLSAPETQASSPFSPKDSVSQASDTPEWMFAEWEMAKDIEVVTCAESASRTHLDLFKFDPDYHPDRVMREYDARPRKTTPMHPRKATVGQLLSTRSAAKDGPSWREVASAIPRKRHRLNVGSVRPKEGAVNDGSGDTGLVENLEAALSIPQNRVLTIYDKSLAIVDGDLVRMLFQNLPGGCPY